MLNGFPCPNPTCSHMFPLTAVSGAQTLTCPRCGLVFQFGTGNPAPALPAAPVPAVPVPAPAVPAFPIAQGFAPPPPMAQPVAPLPVAAVPAALPAAMPAAQPVAFADVAPTDAVRARRPRSRPTEFYLVILTLCLAAGAGVYYAYKHGLGIHVAVGSTESETSAAQKRPPQPEVLYGTRAVYSLRDAQGIWKPDPERKEYYKADLAAQASDPADPASVAGRAALTVFILPRADTLPVALAQAREHLEQLHRKDYPDVAFEVLKDEDALVGDVQGRIMKFHIRDTDKVERYLVLAIVHRKENLLVLHCECKFDRRTAWEDNFTQLLASFRLKGKR